MKNNKARRPLCLEIEDARKELTDAVEQISANHGLPCYLLELILSDVLTRVQNGKRIELAEAQKSWEGGDEE